MDAGIELRAARKKAGLSSTTLARLGHTSIPAISQIEKGTRGITVKRFDSLLRVARQRLLVVPTVTSTPDEIARFVARLIVETDLLAAYRVLLSYSDALSAEEPAVRLALTFTSPQSTGSALHDAVLAGLVRYWLEKAGVPTPDWLDEPRFHLTEATAFLESVYSLHPEPMSVAHAFLVHNVLIDERALGSI